VFNLHFWENLGGVFTEKKEEFGEAGGGGRTKEGSLLDRVTFRSHRDVSVIHDGEYDFDASLSSTFMGLWVFQ
jgi:hypothetical protein